MHSVFSAILFNLTPKLNFHIIAAWLLTINIAQLIMKADYSITKSIEE